MHVHFDFARIWIWIQCLFRIDVCGVDAPTGGSLVAGLDDMSTAWFLFELRDAR